MTRPHWPTRDAPTPGPAMPDIDDDSLDLLPGIVKGLHAYIEELDNDLDNAVARIAALEAGPSSAHNKHQPWFVTATDAEWAELAAWVDWLNENYELTSSNRIVPCWPAHVGASEQIAALWHAWLAAREAQAADIGEHMIAWHERWLWTSLPRIAAALKNCESDRHTPPRQPPPTTKLAP